MIKNQKPGSRGSGNWKEWILDGVQSLLVWIHLHLKRGSGVFREMIVWALHHPNRIILKIDIKLKLIISAFLFLIELILLRIDKFILTSYNQQVVWGSHDDFGTLLRKSKWYYIVGVLWLIDRSNRMSGENVRLLVNWVNRLTGTFYPEHFGNPGRTTFVRDSGQTSVYARPRQTFQTQLPDKIPDFITHSNLIYKIKRNYCWYHIVLNCIDR